MNWISRENRLPSEFSEISRENGQLGRFPSEFGSQFGSVHPDPPSEFEKK